MLLLQFHLLKLYSLFYEVSILVLVVKHEVKKGLVMHTQILIMSILSLDLSELATI